MFLINNQQKENKLTDTKIAQSQCNIYYSHIVKGMGLQRAEPWIVAESPSRRIISPMRLSRPTRTNSYIAAPFMPSATTTGPDTCFDWENSTAQ